MSRHIIVPLDGSTFAETALAQAMAYAGEDGRIDLVTAVEGSPPFSVPDYDALARDWAQRYLASIVERMPNGPWTVHTHILVGIPTNELRSFIDEAEADVVVMATHGRGPFSRAWLGSMADTLLRTSSTPLLLVHPKDGEAPKKDDTSPLEPGATPSKILVTLDGSELSEAAIQPALLMAQAGSTITLLRVVQYPYHFVSPYLPDTIHGNQEVFKQATGQARDYLTEAAWKVSKDGVNIDTQVTVAEHPARAITDFAKSNDIDLIILATHGYGGVVRIALGSVADKIVRTAEVPVLAVRPEKEPDEKQGKKAAQGSAFMSL